MIPNILTLLTEFFKQRIFLDKYEKKFIKFNELKWAKPSEKLHKEKSKSIILVDLFPWYPLIYFWSYLTNIFSRKYDCDIKYYYFNFEYNLIIYQVKIKILILMIFFLLTSFLIPIIQNFSSFLVATLSYFSIQIFFHFLFLSIFHYQHNFL